MMQTRKVDYTEISQCYDETRAPLIQGSLDSCLSKIVDLGKVTIASEVLDVGCGTGLYTIPLAERTNASAIRSIEIRFQKGAPRDAPRGQGQI